MNYQPQAQRILNLLREYEGNWCPLPEIMRLGIASHTRRLFELRKRFIIEMREEWVGHERHTAYRLVGEKGGS
jgi:hypothetical protein